MYTVKRTFELTADVIQIKAAQAGLFSSFFLGKTGSTFFRASSLMRETSSGVIMEYVFTPSTACTKYLVELLV